MTKRDFKGIWLPKAIWLDTQIGWSEKILLAEIDSLCENGQCFASNNYFGEFFGLSKDRISKLISSLAEKSYIEVQLEYFPGTKNVKRRVITTIGYRRKQLYPIGENNYTPIGENAEDINTIVINTKINNNMFNAASPHEIEIPDFFNQPEDNDESNYDKIIKAMQPLQLYEKQNLSGGGVRGSKEWKAEKFEIFWEAYRKKKGKGPALAKWMKLTADEIDKALLCVEDHVIITPDYQYRRLPITWIRQKGWEDDISVELKRYKPANYKKETTTSTYDENSY